MVRAFTVDTTVATELPGLARCGSRRELLDWKLTAEGLWISRPKTGPLTEPSLFKSPLPGSASKNSLPTGLTAGRSACLFAFATLTQNRSGKPWIFPTIHGS